MRLAMSLLSLLVLTRTGIAMSLHSILVLIKVAWEQGEPRGCTPHRCSPGEPGKKASLYTCSPVEPGMRGLYSVLVLTRGTSERG